MRILQIIEFFTPGMGGSVEVAYQLSRHLTHLGHQVTVYTSDFKSSTGAFPHLPFRVVKFRSLLKHWNFYVTPGLIPWVRKHLKEYDIIHMHNVRTFQNAVVAHYAHRYEIPYVLSAHGSLPIIIERKWAKRVFDVTAGDNIMRNGSAFHAVSEVEVEQYLGYGLPKEKIHLIYNGMDLNDFGQLPAAGVFRDKLRVPEGSKVIVHLGRIHKRKNIDLIIRSLAQIAKQEADIRLVIAGPDEGEQAALVRLVRELGLEGRVIFPGGVYGADKLALLQDADLVVSMGVYEIFGLVPFEAMLCGTPAVVSDDCGAGRLVRKGEMGWLAQAGDVDSLAETMRRALADPEAGRKMVQRGRAFIREQMDWDEVVEEFVHMYQSVQGARVR